MSIFYKHKQEPNGVDNPPVNTDDDMRIVHHIAYLATVQASDPQRASILQELLEATYRYEGIAAGDILLAVDQELHGIISTTA